MTEGSTWTSLEVAKLVVSALTPIAVAFLTFAITRATDRAEQARKDDADRAERARKEEADRAERAEKEAAKRAERAEKEAAKRAERVEWANRRAVERLLELHEKMAPLMNDLMCFFRTIGDFRDIDPPSAIRKKRELDKLYFVNEHLFHPTFRERYREFMNECFEHWKSPGEDAKMKASALWLKGERGERGWDDSWNRLFTKEPPDARALRRLQKESYERAMEAFAAQLGLGISPHEVQSQPVQSQPVPRL